MLPCLGKCRGQGGGRCVGLHGVCCETKDEKRVDANPINIGVPFKSMYHTIWNMIIEISTIQIIIVQLEKLE